MKIPFIQIVIGNKNRFAAGNYNENFPSGSNPHSRLNNQDERAIWDEEAFIDRFGFDAPLEQRRDVILIQRTLDFTSREISKLKKSGCMVLGKGKETSLCASRLIYGMGHVFLLFSVSLGFLSYLTLLAVCRTKNYQSMAEALMLFSVILLMLWFSSQASFEPVGMLRKRGLKLGQSWILPKYSRDGSPLHTDQEQ